MYCAVALWPDCTMHKSTLTRALRGSFIKGRSCKPYRAKDDEGFETMELSDCLKILY